MPRMPDRNMSDEAIAQWVEGKDVLPKVLHEEVKKHCRLILSGMVDHNANDPASKRAEAERRTLSKLQDLTMADPANTTIVTIDDAIEGSKFRRMIKVNDRRSYVRGRPIISANEIQWADPTTLSAKAWNFSVSPSILEKGKLPTKPGNKLQSELIRLRGVRSIEKAVCLTKLCFLVI